MDHSTVMMVWIHGFFSLFCDALPACLRTAVSWKWDGLHDNLMESTALDTLNPFAIRMICDCGGLNIYTTFVCSTDPTCWKFASLLQPQYQKARDITRSHFRISATKVSSRMIDFWASAETENAPLRINHVMNNWLSLLGHEQAWSSNCQVSWILCLISQSCKEFISCNKTFDVSISRDKYASLVPFYP